MRAATIAGEKFGVQRLVYNLWAVRIFDAQGLENASGFTQRLLSVFGKRSYLDVGAGTGRFAEALRAAGARADACEWSAYGRREAAKRGMFVAPFELADDPVTGPDPSVYEVAFCLEVAEHVPPALGDKLVGYLAQAPTVVFTAAPPGQGGTAHINEQPKDYWEKRFAMAGKTRQIAPERAFLAAEGELPGTYLLRNLMVFAD